jgi:hypothetical protein
MGSSGSVVRAVFVPIILVFTAGLTGCGSSSTPPATFPTPASIILAPTDQVSVDLGLSQPFTATARDKQNQTITTPISFRSSNTAVVTIASNGLACAGTWDSLTSPQVCTPGAAGVAEITATARGVSSPPTTMYVHQHIDNIRVDPLTPPAPGCVSKDQTFSYAATAFSRGVDITSTVGKFNWQSANTSVVTVDNTVTGLLPNQIQAKAATPGLSSVFASNGGVNSLPVDFTTCAVQSIALEINGSGGNSFTVAKGGTKTINATVLDTQGTTITGVPLTWSSSNPTIAAVGSTGGVSTPQPGGASIIASCTPPTCNIGFERALHHSLPIYPSDVITATVTGASATTTVWVASKGCGKTDGCVSTIVPITIPANTVGGAGSLPATPNSLVFNRQGTVAYLGTDFGLQGTKGLVELTPGASGGATVSMFPSVIGKVLAVSPDGKKVIVSNTTDTPHAVYIFDTIAKTSLVLPINGATAADFSPDSLKAYIASGATLYVFSTVDALQTIALGVSVNDVSFLSNGAFAYLAGGALSAVTSKITCTNGPAPSVNMPATPVFIKALPDATQVLAVDSPGIDLINVNTAPVGCPPTVVNTFASSASLGHGSFTATQLIVSSDGQKAYIVTNDLNDILVFNISDHSSSSIALNHCAVQSADPKDTCTTDNATPIQASLSSDGGFLYVTAADGAVHVLDTLTNNDVSQLAFPVDLTALQGGLCTAVSFTCKPDLIAVKP